MAFSLVFLLCLVTTAAAWTTHYGECSIYYYGLSGVISSPNYPGNYDNYLYCNYIIMAPPGSSLSFFFKSFDVEEGLDFVTISCDTNSSFPSKRFSGSTLPDPVSIPWCSQATVNFKTDGSVVLNGFSLDFYVSVGGCGNTVYSGSHGYVTTPNWPSNYANNLDCYNIIWSLHPYSFRFIFRDFEVQENCTLDWLEMSCLDNSDFDPFRICVYTYPDNYAFRISGCTKLLMWFHSDSYVNAPGFNIEYDVFPHEDCGDTSFYGPSGVISSPNYPGNYSFYQYCENTIYASAESSLSFIFKSFNTELYDDFVRISCPTNSSYPPLEYSGNLLPDPVSIPWCSQGLVYFSADSQTHLAGFSLDYFVSLGGCGNTVYNDSNGYVTSPNWPNDYGNNQNCSNIILAPQESTFVLNFYYFNLHNCCSCDWLEISCLDNSVNIPYKFCGNQKPFEKHITGCTQALLWFHSDGSDNYPGFKIMYRVFPNAGNTNVTGTTTSPPTTTTPPDCDDTYYGPSGVISSPNYPGNYYNRLYCNYYINASPGSSFSFFFKSLDVEKVVDFVMLSCPTNSSFPFLRFSGSTFPDPVSIPWCSQGLVNFQTDGSFVFNGFSLDYYVSVGGCGNTVYTGSNGYVTTPNWPSNYANNQDCYNIIWAPHPYTFRMIFQSFELQENCTLDWLQINCLDNSDLNPLRFCGTYPDNYGLQISGCTQMLLWFHSDSYENAPGFNIEYEVYPHEDCGNTSFYGPSGVISSPNYPGGYSAFQYCENTIYASGESSLSFIFKSFNTELYNDFVRISCPTNSSYPPQEYSGNLLPNPVSIPWCSQGLVYFSASQYTSSTGFSVDYFVSLGGCGNTIYNDSNGYVTTPNYPSGYGYNQNCSNIIWAPQRSTFHLIFWYFSLHSCCTCDWLEISCLDNSAYGPYKYCGYQDSFDLQIQECTQVLLWFHSDGSNNYPGFKIQYHVYPNAGNTSVTGTTIFPPTPSPSSTLPGSTASTSTTKASTTFFVPPSSTASTSTTKASTTFFVPPSSTASTSTTTATTTTVFVPQNCGDTSYYGPSGVISSPNHPGNYANDLSCDYYVNASSLSSSIAIIFETLDTEECCDYVTISCPTNPIYPSWRYSGSTLPQPLSIPGCSRAVVNFITDSSTVSTGFSLDYHISLGGCGDTVYTGSTGYVSSPNYPSDYDSNQNCSNIIWTRLSSSFSINFQYMKVEECCDFVELSCLDNAAYGTHRFTGTTIPPKQTIPQCTQVLVWFYSDDSVVDEGFSLEYTATPESDGQK